MEGTRARWSPALEKGLVDTFVEHNVPRCRRQNKWTHEGWTRILETMHRKFPHAKFNMGQVKEHESEMKKSFKLIKELREKSGMSWDHNWCMLDASKDVWNSLIKENPKVKKWLRKPFPYYDALEKLHEGNIADGNLISTRNPNSKSTGNVKEREKEMYESGSPHTVSPAFGESSCHQDSPDDAGLGSNDDRFVDPPLAQTPNQKQPATQHRPQLLPQSQVKLRSNTRPSPSRTVEIMEEYATMRCGDSFRREDHGLELSITRCVRVMNELMELSREEKVNATLIFKDKDNREIFLALSDDLRTDWIRAMLKLED